MVLVIRLSGHRLEPFEQTSLVRIQGRLVVRRRHSVHARRAIFARAPVCLAQPRRGLKGGHWLGWGPMHHWTDDKIRVHAFTRMLGVSLLQHVRQRADAVCPSLSMEELKQQLGGIQQIELLYPRLGQKGPPRVVSIATKQTLAQQALLQALDLEELIGSLSKPRG